MNAQKDRSVNSVVYHPIGIIRSPHKEGSKTPIQPIYADGCRGFVEIFPQYTEGLQGLEDFSHIFLIFHLHLRKEVKLIVKPWLHDKEKGVFATRSPHRPNAIGLSLVRLEKIEGSRVYVNDLDILDGTPLLDIKPYTKELDSRLTSKDGWLEQIDPKEARKKGRRMGT